MKLLFIKQSLSWPRSSGHDVHGFHMMKACAALGHDVSLATAEMVVLTPYQGGFRFAGRLLVR